MKALPWLKDIPFKNDLPYDGLLLSSDLTLFIGPSVIFVAIILILLFITVIFKQRYLKLLNISGLRFNSTYFKFHFLDKLHDVVCPINWRWMGAIKEDIHWSVKKHTFVLLTCVKKSLTKLHSIAALNCKFVCFILVVPRESIPDNIDEKWTRIVKHSKKEAADCSRLICEPKRLQQGFTWIKNHKDPN